MASPTLKARNLYDYEQQTDGTRTIIGSVADGTGFSSLTNMVVYWDAAGNPVEIFSPATGAYSPRMVNSRSWMYIEDGEEADLQKWNIDVGTEEWGIDAATSALTVNTPTGGGAMSFALSSADNASGANTTYNGTNLGGIVASTYVTIGGFTNPTNNGTFQVVSSTSSTVVVVNAGGIAETASANLTTDNALFPTTNLNGWAGFAHVGAYEGSEELSYNFGLFHDAAFAYTNPGAAFDGDPSTAAYAESQNTHQYYGCVWSFAAPTQTLTGLTLQTLSEVPFNGEVSPATGITLKITNRSSGLWYSLDGGNTWTQIYNTVPRTKQWDAIPIPDGQNLANVQVMAFMDAHDYMAHYVYEINIIGTTTGTGPIKLASGRVYYTAFNNANTGHFSDISPASASSGPVNGGSLPLTDIPVSADPQVTDVYVLATADGGDPSILYFVADLPNGTTVYQDGTPEASLLFNDIYAFTDSNGNEFGLFDNTPPPVVANYPLLHLGRVWMANREFLLFSKNISELTTPSGIVAGVYEESWPSFNTLDISQSAEIVNGLYSDGQVLYVGTDRHIRRVIGDSPANFTLPQVVFAEAGVITQNVWQTVFLEATPVGAMWLTPDYRCLISDFNTYEDVGVPVQTTLNSINRAAVGNIWAQFVGNGPYSLYVLAIPTGTNTDPDTFLVYDLKFKKWFMWQMADNFIAGIYYMNLAGFPRFMVTDSAGIQRVFDPLSVTDRSTESDYVGINTTIQTSWLDFGDGLLRKYINEIETGTTDSNTTVTLMGATNQQDFLTPNVVLASAALVANMFNELKTFPAGYTASDKYYSVQWQGMSAGASLTTDVILGDWSAEIVPLNRY